MGAKIATRTPLHGGLKKSKDDEDDEDKAATRGKTTTDDRRDDEKSRGGQRTAEALPNGGAMPYPGAGPQSRTDRNFFPLPTRVSEGGSEGCRGCRGHQRPSATSSDQQRPADDGRRQNDDAGAGPLVSIVDEGPATSQDRPGKLGRDGALISP